MIPKVRTFQAIVAVNWIAYVAQCFVPVTLFTSNEAILDLVLLDGSGSALGQGTMGAVTFWAGFIAWSIAALGVFFFQAWARTLFAVLLVADVIGSLFYGIRVSYPSQAFAGAIVGATNGFIVALAFLQPLSRYFEQRDAGSEPPPPAPDEIVLR